MDEAAVKICFEGEGRKHTDLLTFKFEVKQKQKQNKNRNTLTKQDTNKKKTQHTVPNQLCGLIQ